MNTKNTWLRRTGLALALAPFAAAAFAGPALAYDHHRERHWDHHDRYHGGYYAPPPPAYYVPERPAPSPGISLFFPIR